MKKRFRNAILCVAAVSALTLNGTAMADNDTSEDTSERTSFWDTVTSKRSETVEPVDVRYSDVTEYLEKIGSVDGYDVYFRAKDIDNIIWDKNGGKPAKKADYTDAQVKLANKIDELKKLGDFIVVEPNRRDVKANFSQFRKSGEELIYVSDGGRFLLYTNSDKTKPLKVREVVSTVDNPYLFRSADEKTLELMSSDYGKVLFTYTESRPTDANDRGKLVFRTSDGKAFAWLSEDGMEVIGTFRQCAETSTHILLVDDRLGNIGIKNKSDGYIWWSSPLGGTRDSIATPLIADELMSSTVLRYGIPAKQNNNNVLRSGTSDCEISVKDIENGVRVTYNFPKAGFRYPVDYTLEDDHLKASLKVAEIEESVYGNIATEVTLMGAFGAASDTEDGYFVIPDGCGALMRFNNGRNTASNAYSRYIYGNDITAVPNSRPTSAEQIYLPVYGIVREGGAMLAVAASGDTNSYISAKVSKQSNSSYNQCAFTFALRGTDTFYLSGRVGDKLTVFENGDIACDDIEMLYFPISGDYSDIAARYRQYLTDNGMTPKTDNGKAPMYVDIYGGVQKKKPVLGVPVTMKLSITDFDEAVDILSRLDASGVKDIVLTYDNWTDDGISDKIDTSAVPSATLGGRNGFRKLTDYAAENGILLYPTSDDREYFSGGGYNKFSGSAMRISGAYARIVSYDRAYGIPDGTEKNKSLLSPEFFGEVYSKAAKSYANADISGISVGSMASSLYGDYGKKHITRSKASHLVKESFSTLDDALENGILAKGANAYTLPYISRISGLPLTSSRFDMFDEDVPFCQMVLHGIMPYSTESVNGSADPDTLLLMAAATGTPLSYDFVAAEASDLKDTEYDIYYYASAESCLDRAAAEYSLLQPIIADVSDSFITDWSNSNGIIKSTFSNGTVVKVNMTTKTIDFNGRLIDLKKGENNG